VRFLLFTNIYVLILNETICRTQILGYTNSRTVTLRDSKMADRSHLVIE